MIRRLLTIALVSSSLICGAATVLWIRSYFTADFVPFGRGRFNQVVVSRGGIELDLGFRSIPRDRPDPKSHWTKSPPTYNAARFRYVTRAPSGFFPAQTSVSVPLWVIALASALVTAATAARKAFKLVAAGKCRCCGYDLRASKERCPECGTQIVVNPQTVA